jgi:DNA-binding Lrp family transcriptional regulator
VEFVIGKSRLVNGKSAVKLSEKLNLQSELPDRFPDPSKLSPNYRKILKFLEVRANENGGDTKASDVKISKALKISLKTVSRGMRRLENLQYITRMTTQHLGARKGCTSRNQFYSLRVIRCNRVFMIHGMPVKTQLELGWKTDIIQRSTVVVKMPEKFVSRKETQITGVDWQGDWVHKVVEKREVTESYLYGNNIKDLDFEEQVFIANELKGYGHAEGKEILGYKHKEW